MGPFLADDNATMRRTKRFLPRWPAASAIAAAVLSTCVAVPASGHVVICRPRFACHGDVCAPAMTCRGNVCRPDLVCPTPLPPPPRPSKEGLAHIIEGYLALHPPIVRLELRRPLGSYAPVAYDDLVRAGLLRIMDGKPGREPGPRYDLTAKGRKLLLNGKQARPGPNIIDIPIGQFRYVPGSAVLGRDELNRTETTFKYVFNGNPNVATLLRISPAIDWVIANYYQPYVNLSRVGRAAEQTLPLEFCYTKWTIRRPAPGCRTP